MTSSANSGGWIDESGARLNLSRTRQEISAISKERRYWLTQQLQHERERKESSMNSEPNFTNNSWKGFQWLLAAGADRLLLLLLLLCLTPATAIAQTYAVLHSFGTNVMGLNPHAPLVQGPDGTLYGTTEQGGSANQGQVFKANPDGSGYTVLKDFTGSDGANPDAGLVLSGRTLYGTTAGGGTNNSDGTVFAVNTDGSGFTVLKEFNGDDGSAPYGGLILSGNTLYGTTTFGGANGFGTVFQINTDGTGFSVVMYCVEGDGAHPYGSLDLKSEGLDNGRFLMRAIARFTQELVVGAVALGMINMAAQAMARPVQVNARILRIEGGVRYSSDKQTWTTATVGDVLKPGTVIQTAGESKVDILLGTEGKLPSPTTSATAGVAEGASRLELAKANLVRVLENSVLEVTRLTTEIAGSDTVDEVELDLRAGRMIGIVTRLSGNSRYEVKMPQGVAGIRADGSTTTMYYLTSSNFVYVVGPLMGNEWTRFGPVSSRFFRE